MKLFLRELRKRDAGLTEICSVLESAPQHAQVSFAWLLERGQDLGSAHLDRPLFCTVGIDEHL
jgi:hypothetical protein